jgi:hypothetical protein
MATSIDPEAVNAFEADKISLKRSLVLFSTWLKDHKYTTTTSVELEGQKGSREANGLELMFQALIGGVTFAAGSLVDAVKEYNKSGLLPGDTLGIQPDYIVDGFDVDTGEAIFIENPDAGQSYIIPGTLRTLYTDIGNAISTSNANYAAIPDPDLLDTQGNVGSMCVNPAIRNLEAANTTLSEAAATNVKADAGGVWKAAVDKYNSFTDALSGVTVGTNGYTLGDAFNAAKGYATDPTNPFNSAVAKITGLKQFTPADFAGSIIKQELLDTFNADVRAYTDAITNPAITAPQLAVLEAKVDTSAQALSDQVDLDNKNYLAHLSQQNAIDNISKSATVYNEAPDEYKDLYASTLSNPGTAIGLSDNINAGKQSQSDAINGVPA